MTHKTISKRIAKIVYAIWVMRMFFLGFGLSGALVNVVTPEPRWVNALNLLAISIVIPVYILRWVALRTQSKEGD